MRIVYIEWEDAVSTDKELNENLMQDWSNIKYMKKQVGFLYEEDNYNITLFSGIHEDDEYYDMFQGLIKIPKSLIRERQDLTVEDVVKTKPDEPEVKLEGVKEEEPLNIEDQELSSNSCDCAICTAERNNGMLGFRQ